MSGLELDRSVENRNSYFLKPIERLLEKQREELVLQLNATTASIETLISHQKTLGTHVSTIDNINSRKIRDILANLSQIQQDSLNAKDKRVYQYMSIAINVVGGLSGLSAVGVAADKIVLGINAVTALKAASDASRALSGAADTMGNMTESTHRVTQEKVQHDSQNERAIKDAMAQSENRMKSNDDKLTAALAKMHELSYQLRISMKIAG